MDSLLGIFDLVNINFNKILENGKRCYKYSVGIYYFVFYGVLMFSVFVYYIEYWCYEKFIYRVVNFNGYL